MCGNQNRCEAGVKNLKNKNSDNFKKQFSTCSTLHHSTSIKGKCRHQVVDLGTFLGKRRPTIFHPEAILVPGSISGRKTAYHLKHSLQFMLAYFKQNRILIKKISQTTYFKDKTLIFMFAFHFYKFQHK